MKRTAVIFLALVLTLLSTGCAVPFDANAEPVSQAEPTEIPSPTPSSAPSPTPRATPTPSLTIPTLQPEATPEPTPWPAERHWWLFTPMGYGLSQSSSVFYNALWEPYLVYPQDGVVIGRIKGKETLKIRTKDPEERVIWMPQTPDGRYAGSYIRSDISLPEPDFLLNDVCVSDGEYVGGMLTDRAKVSMIAQIVKLRTEENSRLRPHGVKSYGFLSVAFRELPGLGCMLPYCLILTDDGSFYFASYSTVVEACVKLDADDPLVTEYYDILVNAQDAEHEFYFEQMFYQPDDAVLVTPKPNNMRQNRNP